MKNRKRFRYFSLIGVLGLFAVFLLVRYALLASQKSSGSEADDTEVVRGDIADRNGRVLAMERALYNIAVWKPEFRPENCEKAAPALASILNMKSEDIVSRYEDTQSDFLYLKKRVDPQVAQAVRDERDKEGYSGLIIEKVAGRLYPERELASHLLGFVGDGNRGLAGLENRYDRELSTPHAGITPNGAKNGASGGSTAAVLTGGKLILSIDSSIQFSLEEIARKTKEDTGAQAVILLAGDARTGELLAYAAEPGFDPNSYYDSPSENWYDWPSVYSYEPGSVFKVYSLASILDLGGINQNSTFVCDGAYRSTAPSGEEIRIKCLGSHGTVNLEKILEYSCNAGAAYASDTVQPEAFFEKLRAFGFGSRSALDFPGESAGLLNPTSSWSLRSKPTIAMGQEILVTAVQMLQAATVISNGGVLMKPIVVRKIVDADGTVLVDNRPTALGRVISPESAAAILSAMESVSGAGGTGWRAKVSDVRMAVKTGTAQMIDRGTKRYSDTDYIASTLAIFPAEDPQVVVYLAIIKPKGESYYGGRIAAPVVREAAEAILSETSLPRGNSPVIEHSGTVRLPRLEGVTIGSTMPDLAGTPKRLLLPLLERKDIVVIIKGEGYVVGQSPAPGTPVSAGSRIELELR